MAFRTLHNLGQHLGHAQTFICAKSIWHGIWKQRNYSQRNHRIIGNLKLSAFCYLTATNFIVIFPLLTLECYSDSFWNGNFLVTFSSLFNSGMCLNRMAHLISEELPFLPVSPWYASTPIWFCSSPYKPLYIIFERIISISILLTWLLLIFLFILILVDCVSLK